MGRWEPDAQGRLAEAALALYEEQGFEQTTVAEIAARAGLTERTFYRYFADKREVLFAGGPALTEVLIAAVEATPSGTAPIGVVAAAVEALGAALQPRREIARRRHGVIAAHPELQERELMKVASFGDALTAGLCARGVAAPSAKVLGETGMAVFKAAFERWTTQTKERDLVQVIRASFDELAAAVAGRS
jgi:AcrR family transcriptional regulator